MDTRLENGDDAREVAAILRRAASAGIDPLRVVVALGLPISSLMDFEATLRADAVDGASNGHADLRGTGATAIGSPGAE